MDYHIFHSTQVEISRDLIAALGGDPMEKGSQALAVNGDAITVSGLHAGNVARCPNLSAYPTVEFDNAGEKVRLVAPASWEAVKAWTPPAAQALATAKPTVISQYAFAMRFTQAERKVILAAMKTDIDVEDAKTILDKASEIDLQNPMTIGGVQLMASKGLLTEDRAAAILTP